MYLWKKLSLLPELPIKDDEKNHLINFASSLNDKNTHELISGLKSLPINLRPFKFTPTLFTCFEQWETFFVELNTWNQNIGTIFNHLKKKIMGNDDLLPITIALLPNEFKQLEQFKKKLDEFFLFEKQGETFFYLINLYAALTHKLTGNKNENEEQEFEKLAKKIRREYQVIELKVACNDYKNYLLKEFLNIFQNEDKKNYQRYFYKREKNNEDKKMLKMLQRKNKKLLCHENKELVHFLNKYMLVLDLHLALQREKCKTKHKLIEFSEKFSHHKLWIKDNSTNFFWDRYTPFCLFKKQEKLIPCEEYFFAIAKFYHSEILEEADAKLLKTRLISH